MVWTFKIEWLIIDSIMAIGWTGLSKWWMQVGFTHCPVSNVSFIRKRLSMVIVKEKIIVECIWTFSARGGCVGLFASTQELWVEAIITS